MDRDEARAVMDGVEVPRPSFPEVYGSPGNAVPHDCGSMGLTAGKHAFHPKELHSASQGPPRLPWEGPSLPLTDVPAADYSHLRHDSLSGSGR